jgi:hypothetical protein
MIACLPLIDNMWDSGDTSGNKCKPDDIIEEDGI